MKFARGLVLATTIGASVTAACGSAPDQNLFSPSENSSGHAGENNVHAGTGNVGGQAGSKSNHGGNTSAGDGGEGSGSSGAPAGGMSSSDAGDSGAAGEAIAGSPSGGGSGGVGVAGAASGGGGGGGASVGGAGAGGSNSGGASVGGAGAGGSNNGGASVGGGGASGAGSGGASAGGAGAGTGGASGANSCPTLPPTDKTVCNLSTPSSCFYPGVACSCLPTSDGPASTRRWACYGTPDKCPSAKPTAGSSCKQNIGAECPYTSQDYCICKGTTADASWVCQAPSATCLTNKPPQNLACGPVRTCQYSDVSCFCNASNWSCLGG